MRLACFSVIAVLVIALMMTTSAVVRLENYHYANIVGFCSQYDITNPEQRIKRHDCLENTETRTHWFWHVLYGLKII
jgi:hypothetical protein